MKSPRKGITSRKIITLLLLMFTLLLVGCADILTEDTDSNRQEQHKEKPKSESNQTNQDQNVEANNNLTNEKNENKPKVESETEPENVTDIRIAAAGDIMFHDDQLDSGYNTESNTYDFKSFFEDVKPLIESADLSLANFESTLGGSKKGFRGYPIFNSPDETIDAIKYAGFDVLTTANNHSLDTGSEGLKRTVKIIREKGLSSVGSYDIKPESRVLMREVKGIKVAILSYTESTNGLGDDFSDEDLNAMLNLMDKDIIQGDVQEAKELEADLIITFMHWGQEYMEEPNDQQIEFAEMMAKEGVDIVLGSHPHVIQKTDFIEVDNHRAFVIYSMGNFVSNQRKETLGDGKENTEDGIIVNIDVRKNNETGETTIQNVEYIPTWVYRDQEDSQSIYTYRILPIEQFLNSSDISEEFQDRMNDSFENTISKMVDFPVEED